MFNLYRSMVSRGKEWRIKTSDQAELVKPVQEAVSQQRQSNRVMGQLD
jgi:hypothetical protein